MSYVALLIISGDKTGHLADWAKTHQYSRFHTNKKSWTLRVLSLVQEWLRDAPRRGKIEPMHLAERNKAQTAAAIHP
jgi:hypothetical protein